MGYELKLFKNSETSQSLGDFLRGRPHIRPLAINGKDGAICREVDEKTVVNKGDSVLTLINHKDEESGAELKQISLLEWSDDLSLGIAQIDGRTSHALCLRPGLSEVRLSTGIRMKKSTG